MNLWSKCVTIFFIICFAGSTSFGEPKTIAVVTGEEFTSYERALKGFRQAVSESGQDIKLLEYRVPNDPNGLKNFIQQLQSSRPNLIVTVGSKSTESISNEIENIPIVFSSVLNPEVSGFVASKEFPGSNLTGASLDIPIKIQLEKFKLLVPGIRRIGVLYTKETQKLIEQAKVCADSLNLVLVSSRVSSEKEIPEALEKLRGKIEGLWAVADENIFTSQSTQFILLFTLRNGLPFMGINPTMVGNGALFTLACDYKDVGRQSGILALKILSGTAPSQIPVSVPRIIYLYLNQKTAKQIDLKFSPDLVKVAKEVYQ
jgi:putative tryptophan/tyrosine transport system substrate-binding protein